MHSLLARAIGGFVAAISAIFAIAKIYIWIVDISTVIDDSKALPEKGKAVLTWIGEQPVIAFYGSLTFFIVIGLWLAFRTGSDQSSAGGPRKIWPWQWRKIDQLEMLYLPQWAAVASGYHPNNLATDELNNIRPWFREFQRIKGAINSGTLLVDGKRISGGGKTYVPRKDIAEFYRSQGDLRPAFFPEKRFLKVLQSRLGAKPVKIEKSDEPVRD